MTPPTMSGWNLALRFLLELAALAGLAASAWKFGTGPGRWSGTIAVPIIAAVIWGTFNVIDDPSRSGAAPVEVAGPVRLTLELSILIVGAVGVGWAISSALGVAMTLGLAGHYLASIERIKWLVSS